MSPQLRSRGPVRALILIVPCMHATRKTMPAYGRKKHIVTKDVVGLLIGKVVRVLKKHIIAKDLVGLLLGEVA
jgi:hypothetical protein